MKREVTFTFIAVVIVIACYGLIGADDCNIKSQTGQLQEQVEEQAKARTVQEQRDLEAYKWFYGKDIK